MREVKTQSIYFIAFTAGLASCLSLIGGIGLEIVTERILPFVPLIIALPALNTMSGDYAAIIAAHAGDPAERAESKRILLRAVFKSIWVNIIGVTALSLILAWRNGYVFSDGFLIKFVIFIIFSMLLVIAAMFIITLLLDKLLEKKNLNPDDLLIPIVTSASDVLMLGLIAGSVVVLFS